MSWQAEQGVEEFINQISRLGKEELAYKRLWEHHQVPDIPVRLHEGGGPIAVITLAEGQFFPDDRRCFHIEKHSNYLPFYIHNHEFLEIAVVMRGSCIQEMNGIQFMQEEGDAIMLPPFQYHAVSVCDDISVLLNVLIPRHAFASLCAPFEEQEGVFGRFLASLSSVRKKQMSALCIQGCKELFPVLMAMSQEGGRSSELDHAFLAQLLARLALQGEDRYRLVETKTRHDARIGAILHYIHENPEKVSLKTLSYAFGMTPAYMSFLIHKMTGSTFSDLLAKRRMELVLQLLDDQPEMTLSRIAEEVGYESVQHLCRIFRRCYHLSPTEYRNRQR